MDPYKLMAQWQLQRLKLERAIACACLSKIGADALRAKGITPKLINDEACRIIVAAAFVAWRSGRCTAAYLADLALRENGFTGFDVRGSPEWLPYPDARFLSDLARWMLDADARQRRAEGHLRAAEELLTREPV